MPVANRRNCIDMGWLAYMPIPQTRASWVCEDEGAPATSEFVPEADASACEDEASASTSEE